MSCTQATHLHHKGVQYGPRTYASDVDLLLLPLLLQLQPLLHEVRDDLEKHRYYPVKGFGDSCLLQPQNQPRRRNRIYIRSH